MKIAHVCPRFYPYIGGVETHVMEVTRRLSNKGFEVEVLTTDPVGNLPKEEVLEKVKIRRFASWAPGESYFFSNQLRSYLVHNSRSYEIVHAHSYHAFPALYAARSKSKNRFIFTSHFHGGGHTFMRNLLHIPYKYVAKNIFEKADYVVSVSSHEKNLIAKKFKVSAQKIVVIPDGINQAEFPLMKKEQSDKKMILYVGRLENYKGVDYIVKVLPLVDDDIQLEIVGKGPHRNSILSLVNRLGISNRVRLSQDLSRQELLNKYSEASLFVLLSKYEAFGIVVAEALASGTPCIVTNSSALAEWIDNKNCFGMDYPIDLGKLADLINRTINLSVESPEIPSWDTVVERLIMLYEQTLDLN